MRTTNSQCSTGHRSGNLRNAQLGAWRFKLPRPTIPPANTLCRRRDAGSQQRWRHGEKLVFIFPSSEPPGVGKNELVYELARIAKGPVCTSCRVTRS